MAKNDLFTDKNILITGGTGTLGKALAKRLLLSHEPKKVIVFSRDEYKQHLMQQEFDETKEPRYGNLRFQLGDVRDIERLRQSLFSADFVIHTAALKQIPAIEYNPQEAVKTNILGSENVVRACCECGIEMAVFVSTDKAVNPINFYGATKLCAEKLFISANVYNKTAFSAVRYGNVLNSRGSVIERFLALREQGASEFPITDLRMTRFWLTVEEAVDLVLKAFGHKGKILIPKAPSMKITDIAKTISPDCLFKEIGIRAGEKLHECLVSEDNKNIWMVDDNVYPAEADFCSNTNDRWLTPEELRRKLNL